MVALIVVLLIVAFITADVLVRSLSKKLTTRKLRREREEALDIGLRLDYTDQAKSLKRVTVENPKARILAVDDEAIVLDSFRKILVFVGYSIDTVETAPEAVGLVKKNEYEFVFTDLKMPDMDGLDVVKAVKHLRPDIDVIMITGYATIESAVDAMKYGAMDYVQKPFTEDELVDFVNKSLLRRQDRIERQKKPTVHLVTPSSKEAESERVYNVPAGLFISPHHLWIGIEMDGRVCLGLDDFAQKVVGRIEEIVPPRKGQSIRKGETIYRITRGSHTIEFPSPMSGKIIEVNAELIQTPGLLKIKPYELGWLCRLEADDLSGELSELRIGAEAISWYRDEIDKYQNLINDIAERQKTGKAAEPDNGYEEEMWEAFPRSFLHVH